jgi:hypothetical protein
MTIIRNDDAVEFVLNLEVRPCEETQGWQSQADNMKAEVFRGCARF